MGLALNCQRQILRGLSIICLQLGLICGVAWGQSAADYRQQGLSYRQQGQMAAAIAAFRNAVTLDPDNLSGRVLLGWTLHLDQQRSEAATVLTQTVQLAPSHVPALNALGIVYLVDGQLWPSVLTHSWAALLKPDNEIAYYNLSLAFQRLALTEWADLAAQRAIQLEPYNPHPYLARAIVHWGQADSETAYPIYEAALALDGRYGDLDFLNYLLDAGFSPAQVQLTQDLSRSHRTPSSDRIIP